MSFHQIRCLNHRLMIVFILPILISFKLCQRIKRRLKTYQEIPVSIPANYNYNNVGD